MAATTPAAIRDRIRTVVAALTPTSDSKVLFIKHESTGVGDITVFGETQPAAAYRVFQVKETGSSDPPETSDATAEERVATFVVTIAYPNDYRYGSDLSLDRDDIMREDEFQITKAIGHLGAANFTSPTGPDATWLLDGSFVERIESDACTYLQITQRMLYVLSVA